MTQQDPSQETVDRWAFAETVESDVRRPGVRLGPALGAAAAAAVVVVAAAVIPQIKKDPLGTARGPATTAGQPAAGQAPAGQASMAPQQTPQSGGGDLTYANHAIAGPGGACCSTSGGAWSPAASGGYPEYTGPVRTTTDRNAWYEWNLGRPAGGARWDQIKVRLWIPQAQAGAWVRVTVTSTAGSASNVATFDVAEQEYQGWYELPATFTIGTPDRRTGSAWVKMTYLRPYTDQAAAQACADDSCDRMAAAQAEFLWS
ncbi:hypothetical protein [Actinoallomurus iriomotensis]|uniref:Uncharacterized protein n=1 Tax=Actinoallomurus iriomotensis TaxID=478107 RepID=A0A9W6RUG5_9ACTN|nr:hypothetical protein [Actinoallomurus iriomotensis]GLY81898.1 hypothetical protein Airi01_101650 [Actinoallomurus iriomotensis]